MFEKLRDLLRTAPPPLAAAAAADDAVPLAAAMLLLEVAWADHTVTDDETNALRRALGKLYDLPAVQLDDLLAASRKQHEASVGVYEYTRELNEALDAEAKQELLVELWRLALADEDLDRYEEHTIRRIAELLYVPHAGFIAAKQAARESLAAR